jgi:hypothetical protein
VFCAVGRRDEGACGRRQRIGGAIMHQGYTELYTINPSSSRNVSQRNECYAQDILTGRAGWSPTHVTATLRTRGAETKQWLRLTACRSSYERGTS